MSKVEGDILGAGIAVLTVVAGAIWKTAGMRGEVRKNFNQRMSLAQAGLDENAANSLRNLAERVNKLLGDLDQFDPTHALADPAELQDAVSEVQRDLTARRKISTYYEGLLQVGPIALLVLIAFGLSLVPTFAYLSEYTDNKVVGYVGMGFLAAALLAGVLLTARYIYLQSKFCAAELLSDKASSS